MASRRERSIKGTFKKMHLVTSNGTFGTIPWVCLRLWRGDGKKKSKSTQHVFFKEGEGVWRRNYIIFPSFFFKEMYVDLLKLNPQAFVARPCSLVCFLWVCASALNQTAIMAAVFLPAQQLSCLAQMLISFWLGAKRVIRAKQPELGCAAGLEVRAWENKITKFFCHIQYLLFQIAIFSSVGWGWFCVCVCAVVRGPCGLLCYAERCRCVNEERSLFSPF